MTFNDENRFDEVNNTPKSVVLSERDFQFKKCAKTPAN